MLERLHDTRVFSTDPLTFREARRWVLDVSRHAGLGRDEAHALAAALSELCANIHRHAYAGRRDGRIELLIDAEGGRVVTTVSHGGVPFDPRAYVPPDLSRPEERGYGMYLIAQLVDDVTFVARPDGGTIVLVKTRRRAPEAVPLEQGVR